MGKIVRGLLDGVSFFVAFRVRAVERHEICWVRAWPRLDGVGDNMGSTVRRRRVVERMR